MKIEGYQKELRRRRFQLGLAKREAARQIGICYGSLWRFENNKGDISARKFIKILNWLAAT